MALPSAGQWSSTARISRVPTTHSAYDHPSDNTSQTCSGARCTSTLTTAMDPSFPFGPVVTQDRHRTLATSATFCMLQLTAAPGRLRDARPGRATPTSTCGTRPEDDEE